MPARLMVGVLMVVVGCTSLTVPSPSLGPTSTSTAPPTASLTPTTPAQPASEPADLTVTGTGACGGSVVINYGGCRALLLLEATSNGDFSDRVLSDHDYAFEMGERTSSEIFLTGPLTNGPRTLAPGHWTVGLGQRNSSDIADEPDWLSVLCYRPFEIRDGTRHVEIHARFEARCGIDILLDDVPVPTLCTDETFHGLDDAGRDRFETKTYPEEHLATVTVTAIADPTYSETATLDYEDPACLGHRLIGPVLRGVVEGFEPISEESADLVGRLILPNAGVGCSMLIDADGLAW